jgi:hypothetical protein
MKEKQCEIILDNIKKCHRELYITGNTHNFYYCTYKYLEQYLKLCVLTDKKFSS